MTLTSVSNLLALSIQVAVLAVTAAIVAVVFRISRPAVRYGFWRSVLALCLVFPWLQTPRQAAVGTTPLTGASQSTASVAGAGQSAVSTVGIDWMFVLAAIAAIGILFRLVWLTIGSLKLRRLRVAGEPVGHGEHAALQSAIGTEADVRYVATVRQPVTFGVVRPVVLLPTALGQHSPATREAVIAHELVHVRRRDWCWVIAEELLRTALWFHPAVWWLISRVQLAREEVVDATAVAVIGDRRAYVEAMLAFADEVPLAPAPAFARRRHLFRRIVLLSTEEVMSARRIVASVVAMAVVIAAAGWSAVRALPLERQTILQAGVGPLEQAARPINPDNPMPKSIHRELATFPTEADGENASVTVSLRTVVDQAGFVAELRLSGFAFQMNGFSAALNGGPEAAKQFEQLLRNASFRSAAGADYVGVQTLRPLLQAFIDSASAAVQQWRYESPREAPIAFDTVVQFTTGRPVMMTTRTTTAAGSQMAADGAVRIGGAVRAPTKLRDVKPVYPQEAQEARVQGVVIIEARIEGDGRVSAAQVLRSIPMLDAAALDAVKQWEFQPTLLNGVPTPVIMTVTVQFTLQ